jgi:uncharacterized protein
MPQPRYNAIITYHNWKPRMVADEDPGFLQERPPTPALTVAEIRQLDDFLKDVSLTSAKGQMRDITMLDGFITALATGPGRLLSTDTGAKTEVIRWIRNTAPGDASPPDEDEAMMRLLVQHWDAIGDTVDYAPDSYHPLIVAVPPDSGMLPGINRWCAGYCHGMLFEGQAWWPVLQQHPEWFVTIREYGLQERAAPYADDHELPSLSPASVAALTGSIIASVRCINEYWADADEADLIGALHSIIAESIRETRSAPVPSGRSDNPPLRRSTKIGRNEPCYCGSGRKYKRCHGA